MDFEASYPTSQHQRAAEALVEFFRPRVETEAVLLLNSCARGFATPDSCLDIAVLVRPELLTREQESLERTWQDFFASHAAFEQLKQVGRFSVVHFDYVDGAYDAAPWDDGGGPDGFELGIGNQLVYGVPLWEGSDYLAQLKGKWLPYYDEALCRRRLAMVRHGCLEDLEHIPWLAGRDLYFAAFDRLYRALQEYLQALFIAHRTYPIAYNKWIRQQVEGILGQPELYKQIRSVLEISQLESPALLEKTQLLKSLINTL